MKEKSCCSQCCHSLAKEFQKDKFSLEYVPVEVFFKSQWQRRTKSIWWLIYRWLLAAFFSAGVLGSAIQHFSEGKWFIYLTDWGFVLCMFTSIYGAVLVTIYCFNPYYFDSGSLTVKLYWASHWSTLVLAILISFIYWILLFPADEASGAALYNLWAHAFNSVFMLLDHMLVAFPTRLLHAIYPFSLGILYAFFSLIYYLLGGVDPFGNEYIYFILDWSTPGWAILTVFGCLVLVAVFIFLLFALYKLRVYMHRKCCGSSLMTLNT